MLRFYIAVAFVTAFFLAYITGVHVGNVRCDAHVADMRAKQIVLDTQISGEINETVIHTGVGDIRRILYEKYTIAE